jgi:hypothetical protein
LGCCCLLDTWTRCIIRNPALSKISTLIIVNLYFISKNNETVQQFISKSEYNASRQRFLNVQSEGNDVASGSKTQSRLAVKKSFGYLPSLLDYLMSVRAADSIALVAAGIIFDNRTLSRVVVSTDLINFIAGILRKYGPSQKLIGLFSAMISGSRKHIAKNQNLILEVVCSATSNPVFIDNRRSIIMETQLHDNELFVTWSGSAQYIRGRSIDAELFYDPATLGLKTHFLSPPVELQAYLNRRKTSAKEQHQLQWTKLSNFAWYIDPANCFYFWKNNPTVAWSKHYENMTADNASSKLFRENLDNLKSLCEHYLGVIELCSNLCSKK